MLTLTLLVLSSAPAVAQADAAPCADVQYTPFLAVTVLPGAGVTLDGKDPGFSGSLNLEVRLMPWLVLRTGYELRRAGHAIDFLGVKLSPQAGSTFRPWLGASVSGDFPKDRPQESFLGATVALGLDLTLGSGFFLATEARVRFISHHTPAAGAFVGVGFEFF